MKRLLVKWETARTLIPAPKVKIRDPEYRIGLIFYGTSTHSTYEAVSRFSQEGVELNSLRVRAFPFQDEVVEFIDQHEVLFVIEQNRDGQLRTMLMSECGVDPKKLQSILNIDGLPITANFITNSIRNSQFVKSSQSLQNPATTGGKS